MYWWYCIGDISVHTTSKAVADVTRAWPCCFFLQKNHKQSDDRASWCNSEPTSPYSCVSREDDRNTTTIPHLDADSTSADRPILPPLRTPCVEGLLRIDEASLPSRFDAQSESESGINSSSVTSEQLIISVETPQEVFDYIGRTEPVLLEQSETTVDGRSPPDGIQQHASSPSLPTTVCSCDHAIDDAYLLDSTSPDLAQTELALPVLSSARTLEKRSDASTAENVLPKIDPGTDRGAECDFQAIGGRSTAVSGSAGIRISPVSLFHRADQISLIPSSSSSTLLLLSQLSLTECSFGSHDPSPSLKPSTQNTDYPTISNADDEGIYIWWSRVYISRDLYHYIHATWLASLYRRQ